MTVPAIYFRRITSTQQNTLPPPSRENTPFWGSFGAICLFSAARIHRALHGLPWKIGNQPIKYPKDSKPGKRKHRTEKITLTNLSFFSYGTEEVFLREMFGTEKCYGSAPTMGVHLPYRKIRVFLVQGHALVLTLSEQVLSRKERMIAWSCPK